MTIDEVITWKERGALLLRSSGEAKRIAVGVLLLALVSAKSQSGSTVHVSPAAIFLHCHI